MKSHLRLLDLFCGAGGAAVGYHRAGFDEIVGVDNRPMPRYPFTFVLADALEYAIAHGQDFDVIHASPPCQKFTKYKNTRPQLVNLYPDHIEPIRTRLLQHGVPWVIENVPGSPLQKPLILCGSMFGLDVQRHRLFESSELLMPPQRCNHKFWPQTPRYPGGRSKERGGPRILVRRTCEIGRWNIPLWLQSQAMGIDWMTLEELSEAIPPTYTECIGRQLVKQFTRFHSGTSLGV